MQATRIDIYWQIVKVRRYGEKLVTDMQNSI